MTDFFGKLKTITDELAVAILLALWILLLARYLD